MIYNQNNESPLVPVSVLDETTRLKIRWRPFHQCKVVPKPSVSAKDKGNTQVESK
tara:strand:+ start:1138 stop:1302 length:165 start_codon:yes stop_codon:yes gene_type:complete